MSCRIVVMLITDSPPLYLLRFKLHISTDEKHKAGDIMEKAQTTQEAAFCKSVFRNDDPSSIKREITKKWIELINMMEKNKNSASGTRQ